MEIKTKFSIDEFVYFLNKKTHKIENQSIERLFYETSRAYGGNPRPVKITYQFNSSDLGTFNENELFKTKEELLLSL